MKTIHKYQLDIADEQFINIPEGAKILTVQSQREKPCLWALVDTEKELESISIRIYGTGHYVKDNHGKYIGTFQIMNGDLVFHVFVDE